MNGMIMNGIMMYVIWLVGPVLQITLLVLMIQRRLHVVFPRFFSYIVFQVVKSGVLFGIYRYYHQNYFDAYWTGNAISVLLSVTVMDEILHSLLESYGGIQRLTSLIFRWSCGLLLLLSIVNAFSTQQSSSDRVISIVLAFDRSVRVMQCGLFFLLLVLTRLLRNCWRQNVFGIALGFGLFASIELILVTFVMQFGDRGAAVISLIKSAAYNGVTLLWVMYLCRSTESMPVLVVSPRTDNANAALGGPIQAEDSAFLSMVEDAVDRVLTRGSWPKPSIARSQIIGRKPQREERN
ncbi:MAG: hypothetical protein ACM3ND_11050 [Acidobacteriota bacterium]|jgi:hypothetical protein